MNIDFKTFGHRDDIEKGITFHNGKRSRIVVYVHQHESIDDIFNTITHELIHYCIDKHDMARLDEYQEHDAIFKVMWADSYLS